MVLDTPQRIDLVPGAAVYRQAIPSPVVDRLRNALARALADVPLAPTRRDRLISAWSGKLIDQAAEEVSPLLEPLAARHIPDGSLGAQYLRSTLFVASSRRSVPTHAHQDIAYRWRSESTLRYAVTIWLSLHAAGRNRAALLFSRSMPQAQIAERVDFLRPGFVDLAATAQWKAGEVVADVVPGDLVVFNSLVWHAAAPCAGGSHRWALAVRWRSTSGWEERLTLPPPKVRPGVFGMDTSGSILRRAVGAIAPEWEERDLIDIADVLAEGRLIDLDADARAAFRDLRDALRLARDHGGRPASEVWLRLRDRGLPALEQNL